MQVVQREVIVLKLRLLFERKLNRLLETSDQVDVTRLMILDSISCLIFLVVILLHAPD